MTTIKPKIVYPYNGKEYSNIEALKRQIQNEIGKIIDEIRPVLPPKQALSTLEVIINNREKIKKLLDIEIENSNIFDL